MGIDVRVRPEALKRFSQAINGFSRSIRVACNTLAGAAEKFRSATDSASTVPVERMLSDIEQLLGKAQPSLTAIEENAELYYQYLSQLRNISAGNGGGGGSGASGAVGSTPNTGASLSQLQSMADQVAQEYNARYDPPARAKRKGYGDVIATPNGGVSYERSSALYKKADGTPGIVRITATGARNSDFDLADTMLGLPETPAGYVWHHLDDYDVKSNTITMQLVSVEAHNAAKPHSGGCAQYDAVHGPSYNPPRKV